MAKEITKEIIVTLETQESPDHDERSDTCVAIEVHGINHGDLAIITRLVAARGFGNHTWSVGQKQESAENVGEVENQLRDFKILLKPEDRPEEFIIQLQKVPSITNRMAASEEARQLSQRLMAGKDTPPGRHA